MITARASCRARRIRHGTPDRAEHDRGEPGPKSRGAGSADQREEAFGERGADLETGHRDHQHDERPQQRSGAAVGLFHVDV